MHIIHSVSRIYTDRRRMTFTFLLRWPSSCLNPILMRTDDVVDVDKCDALVLAICWLLQHNFHDCPNYNLSVTHDDYSDLPSQHLSRFVYERQPSVSVIHVGQLSQSDIYSKLKLCALNCNKHIIENGDEWIKKKNQTENQMEIDHRWELEIHACDTIHCTNEKLYCQFVLYTWIVSSIGLTWAILAFYDPINCCKRSLAWRYLNASRSRLRLYNLQSQSN